MTLIKKFTDVGTKARQLESKEDRSLAYRDLRRQIVGRGNKRNTCYTSDIDQVEYIIVRGEVIPVAIIEVTRYDFNELDYPIKKWGRYRNAVINRYFHRDAQGKFIKKVSKLLKVPAYLVLFRYDVESFWILDINANPIWIHKSKEEYIKWIISLKQQTFERFRNGKNR